MKILIKNFQSIADAMIEANGFTVITGRTHLGKSAVRRAISAAFFGKPGDYYIKDGEAQCGVAISDNGLLIKWRKVAAGKATPTRNTSLEINGVVHTKLNKDHAKLTDPLGFKEIQTTDVKLRPQIAEQQDLPPGNGAPFLLVLTETVAAEVLKQLGRADVITEAQRLAKKDLRDTEKRQELRKEDLLTAQIKFAELDFVLDLRKKFDEVEHEFGITEVHFKRTEELLVSLRKHKNLSPKPVPAVPAFKGKPTQVDLKAKLQRFLQLHPVTVPTAPGPAGAPIQWVELQMLRDYQQLTPRPVPTEPPALKVPNIQLIGKARKFYDLCVEETVLRHQQADLDQAIFEMEIEKREMEKKLGKCPLCQRSFDVERTTA